MGEESALLLVGSRGAGFIYGGWSDLDLWVIGHSNYLTESERAQFDLTQEYFVDQGDYEAHFTFFDIGILEREMGKFPVEKMWILSTSKKLKGSFERLDELINSSKALPKSVAGPIIKRELGKYMFAKSGCLSMAARSKEVATSVWAVGQIIDSLCKICCLAECKPFPYSKWRVKVARDTIMGKDIFPVIDCAIQNINELVIQPSDKSYREWIPVKSLRSLLEIVIKNLKGQGWSAMWIDDPMEAISFDNESA